MPCQRIDQLVPHLTTMYITEEETWGVFDSGAQPLGIEFASESFQNEIRRSQGRRYIGSGRAAEASLSGIHRPGGAIEGEIQPHGFWPLILRYTLGDPVQSTGPFGPVYVHQLQGTDTLPPGGLTIEKVLTHRRSGTKRRFRYEGCKVDSLFMRIATGQPTQARATFLARRESNPEGDPLVPDYPMFNNPFLPHEATLTIDTTGGGSDTAVNITAAEVTIANNLNGSRYGPESGPYRVRIPAGVRTITGNLRAFFTDVSYAAYLADLGEIDGSFIFVLDKEDPVNETAYKMQVSFPAIRFRVPAPQVTGKGPITADIRFVAHKDADAGTDCHVLLFNLDPTLTTT